MFEAILTAAEQMGIPRVADVNDITPVRDGGIGYQPSTCHGGERFSSARSFLDPVKGRTNLCIMTRTDALKIEFDGKRAAAVLSRDRNGTHSVRATREIILSAGAIQTPKLLQLSGIGPSSVLEPLGIPVLVDSPDVGRNLGEHRHVDLRLRVRDHSQNTDLSGVRAAWSLLKYLASRISTRIIFQPK